MMRLYVCHAIPAWYAREPGAEAVKIGVSRNPFRRKWGLRRAGCDSPKLIWQSPEMPRRDAYKIESELKRRLARHCVAGAEWFRLSPATVIKYARAAIRQHRAKQ